MLYTIKNILKDKGIAVEDTVYAADISDVLQFEISAGDFFEVCRDKTEYKVYEGFFEEEKQETDQSTVDCEARLAWIKNRLKELKTEEENVTHAHADEIKQLRLEKKQLSQALGIGDNTRNQKMLVKYKNCLYAASFNSIKRVIPKLKNVNFRCMNEMPIFVKNLSGLKEAIDSGREVAITGGPCLFGVHEVLVNVTYKDNGFRTYDFSSGRRALEDGSRQNLAEDLMTYEDDVLDINFVNRKVSATTQEYDSIHYLFEVAHALRLKLTIPLPDMSYIKFFKNIAESVRPEIAEKAIQKFSKIAYEISDLYLAVIDEMHERYPDVVFAVIHGRDEKMLKRYYEGRQPFLTPTMVKNLTTVQGKTDSVLDYITMPALPYYIWGIKDIIQMDCLDEADSYRKCVKMHKGALNIYAMLYPERISGDSENTIFYAPLKYKEYLSARKPKE